MKLQRREWLALAASLGTFAAQASTGKSARLISIGGALTELVYALNLQAQLVGVDSTSLFPAAARELPQVGYARTLSAEGLLSLSPALIVATEDAGPPQALRQIELARVPLHILRADHQFEGLLSRTQQLGQLLNCQAEAAALQQRLRSAWQASQAQVQALSQGKPAPKVLFILSHGMGQVRIAGHNTAADAMIRYAGARNATAQIEGYKALTPEAAIAAAPDVILCTDQGLKAAGSVAALLKLPGLVQTPAGRTGRVISLEALELLGFGPRLPQAVAKLAAGLYPRT